jgi:effector-binding domain-containing protein
MLLPRYGRWRRRKDLVRRSIHADMTLLSLLLPLFAGCGSSERDSTVVRSTESSEPGKGTAMKSPFMFREAKLPKDFPPPGPVGEIVTKDYPAYRLARVRSGKDGVSGGPNAMFNPLFKHIKRNNIAMTAPVEIGYPNRPDVAEQKDPGIAESMAFLYGDPSWGEVGADAADSRVVVEDVPAMKVVSIGVRGNYTDDRFTQALGRLTEWLEANRDEFQAVGPPRYLGYNSPSVPGFLRYGEVQLPIDRVNTVNLPASSRNDE